ncbi:MAG TPA: hypothetical protein VMU62_00610, partial [Acidobacteriaceae bacterium]|nr:hypothetical protein [Acidobacteriaceae bacterium]
MKRNHTWVHSTVGVAAMAVCLTASSALAQMSESMPGGGNNSSMGQMHAPGQQPGQQPGNNMPGQQPGNMSTQQNNANTMMDQSFLRSVMQNAQIETDLS